MAGGEELGGASAATAMATVVRRWVLFGQLSSSRASWRFLKLGFYRKGSPASSLASFSSF